MSQATLALLASPETQAAIRNLGGAVPDLRDAASAAQAETLKRLVDTGKESAVGVLQGFTAHTSDLVKQENELNRQLAEIQKKKAKATLVNFYFNATGNIFPMQKLIGIPTAGDVLRQFPDIDKIADGWTPPAAEPTTAA